MPETPASLPARVSDPKPDKGRRTWALLIEAGKVVFARDGFLKARIADIASGAYDSYAVMAR